MTDWADEVEFRQDQAMFTRRIVANVARFSHIAGLKEAREIIGEEFANEWTYPRDALFLVIDARIAELEKEAKG